MAEAAAAPVPLPAELPLEEESVQVPLPAELPPEEESVEVPVPANSNSIKQSKDPRSRSTKKVKEKKSKFDPFQESQPLTFDDVKCTVCLSIMIEPVTFPCNHTVCKECFMTYVRDTSLNCPLCRLRLGVWLRKAGKEHSLINMELWKRIEQEFQEEVQARLNGEDSQNDYYSSKRSERIDGQHAEPGALREEYEFLLAQFREEEERARKAEEEASNIIIRQEQEEEAHFEAESQAQLKADAEFARRLQEEEDKRLRGEVDTAKEFQEMLFRQREVAAALVQGKSTSSQSRQKTPNTSLSKRKLNSPLARLSTSPPESKRHCSRSQGGFSQTRLSVNEGLVSVSRYVTTTSPSNNSQRRESTVNVNVPEVPRSRPDEDRYSYRQFPIASAYYTDDSPPKPNQNQNRNLGLKRVQAVAVDKPCTITRPVLDFDDLDLTFINVDEDETSPKNNVDDFQPYWDNLTKLTDLSMEQILPGPGLVLTGTTEKARKPRVRIPSDSSDADSTTSLNIFDDEAFILRQVEKNKKHEEQEEMDRKLALRLQREWNSKVYVERDYETRNREKRRSVSVAKSPLPPLREPQSRKSKAKAPPKKKRQSGQTKRKSTPGGNQPRRTLDSYLVQQPLREIQPENVETAPDPPDARASPTKSDFSLSPRRRSISGSSVTSYSSSSSSGSSTQANLGSPLRRPPPNTTAEL